MALFKNGDRIGIGKLPEFFLYFRGEDVISIHDS